MAVLRCLFSDLVDFLSVHEKKTIADVLFGDFLKRL